MIEGQQRILHMKQVLRKQSQVFDLGGISIVSFCRGLSARQRERQEAAYQ
jgi:hypothetical protein